MFERQRSARRRKRDSSSLMGLLASFRIRSLGSPTREVAGSTRVCACQVVVSARGAALASNQGRRRRRNRRESDRSDRKATAAIDPANKMADLAKETTDQARKVVVAVDPPGKAATVVDSTMVLRKEGGGDRAGERNTMPKRG